MDKDFDKIREWVENNIFPNEYQTRDEFESDIDQRIEGYSDNLGQDKREAIWSDYQDLVESVERIEEELGEAEREVISESVDDAVDNAVNEAVQQEDLEPDVKRGLVERISNRLKSAIDKLLGVFGR